MYDNGIPKIDQTCMTLPLKEFKNLNYAYMPWTIFETFVKICFVENNRNQIVIYNDTSKDNKYSL